MTWLANWTENINKASKYVFLAATSSLKGQSDLKKYENARELVVSTIHLRLVHQLLTSQHRDTSIASVKTTSPSSDLPLPRSVNESPLSTSSTASLSVLETRRERMRQIQWVVAH